MDKPIISVIIPVYNTENYLNDCLASVQSQTLSDIEVLIINDETPDNSMAIAQKYAEEDSRFSIIEHKVNKGLGGARNTGINQAKGEYIFFLDSDDLIPVDSLELLWNASSNGQSDMVFGNMAWFYQHHLSPVEYIDTRLKGWQTYLVDNLRNLPTHEFFTGSIANRFIKNDVIKTNKLVFPEKLYFEDMIFSVEVWHFSGQIRSILNMTYFRRKRDDPTNLSITQTINKKSFYDRDKIAELIFTFCTQHPGSEEFGIYTLFRIAGKSREMLKHLPVDFRKEIITVWFPKHVIKINKMIKSLNKKFS